MAHAHCWTTLTLASALWGCAPLATQPSAPHQRTPLAANMSEWAEQGAVAGAAFAAEEPRVSSETLVVWDAAQRASNALAQAATDLSWRRPRPITPLYERMADDIDQGNPVVMVGFYGMWFDFEDEPERNLNWGTYYGHARMLGRVHRDRHVAANYTYASWQLALEAQAADAPVRTLVYHQRVKPNRRWRDAGVTETFDTYLVMLAYPGREEAGVAMTRALRLADGPVLTLDDGTTLAVGDAQVMGYFGHNFFYDYDDFLWGGLDEVAGAPTRPVGVAAVGCKTGRVPGFPRLLGENVMALLFSRSLMASEGYSTLALADGVLRMLDSRELVDHANQTYRYFHTISDPDKRVGRPFIGHDAGLFPIP